MSAELPNNPAALAAKAQKRRRIIDSWPTLVWIGVAVVAFFAYLEGASFHRMNGTVVDDNRKVASTEKGKIEEILVDFGDTVKKGQVVCRLYTDELEREIELVRQESRMANREAKRRSLNDITKLDLEIKEQKAQMDNSQADLDGLRKDLARVKQRLTQGRATADEVAEKQDDVEKEVANVNTHMELIRSKEATKEELQIRLDDLNRLLGTDAAPNVHGQDIPQDNGDEGAPHQGAVEALDPPEVRLLNTKLKAMTLISPTDGTVTMRHAEPGDVVEPGVEILEISSSEESIQVAALIPAQHIAGLKKGDILWVTTPSKRAVFIEAKIITVGQKLISVVDGGSVVDRNTSGRPIILELVGDHDIVPGSPVYVHLKKPSLFKFLYWLR